jgi:hypothetical protein
MPWRVRFEYENYWLGFDEQKGHDMSVSLHIHNAIIFFQ